MADFAHTIRSLCRGSERDHSVRQLAVVLACFDGSEDRRMTKALAEDLNISKPAITRASDRLVEDGLVRRSTPNHDRRLCILTLTPTGMALARKLTDGFPPQQARQKRAA